MILAVAMNSTTLYGYIGVLFASLIIGIFFAYLHFRRQKLFYKKKKTWKFNDSVFEKILDWIKRNIFGIFAFIFLFSTASIIMLLITNAIN